jgi:hypothetical protein
VVGEVEARQGYLDRPVLIVLALSTFLAVVLLALIWPVLT